MAIYANEDGVVKDLTPFGTGAIKIFRITAKLYNNQSGSYTVRKDITDLIDDKGSPTHIIIFSHYFDWYSAGQSSAACHLYWHLEDANDMYSRSVKTISHVGNAGVSNSINTQAGSDSSGVYITIDIRTTTTTKYIESNKDDITVLMIWE